MHGTEGFYLGKHRPGPKRKRGDRYPCGKLKQAPLSLAERRAQGTLIWQRVKDEIVAMGKDARFASVIGRMAIHEILTDGEAMTAAHIAAVIGRFERLTDAPKRSAASQAFLRGYNEQPNPYARGDQDTISNFERQVRRARKAHDEVWKQITDACGRNVVTSKLARDAIYDLCVNDREISAAHHDDLKRLLGYVGQKLGYIANASKPGQRQQASASDLQLIAAAAVDAFERFFTANGAEVAEFVVGLTAEGPLRSLSGWGKPNGQGTSLRHAVRVSAGDLSPALLDAALRNAAIKRGWAERYVDREALTARVEAARKAQEEVTDGQQAPS